MIVRVFFFNKVDHDLVILRAKIKIKHYDLYKYLFYEE